MNRAIFVSKFLICGANNVVNRIFLIKKIIKWNKDRIYWKNWDPCGTRVGPVWDPCGTRVGPVGPGPATNVGLN